MTVSSYAWPASAKVVEMRLGIETSGYGSRSPLDRRLSVGPVPDEIWAGDVLLADVSVATMHELRAFAHQLEGQTIPFQLPLYAGIFGRSASAVGTVATTATRQSGSVVVTLPSGAVIPAGATISFGFLTDDNYQFCDVLADFTPGTGVTVQIAPRIRSAIPAGTQVVVGGTFGRFVLARDDVFAQQNLDRGSLIMPVREYT